MFRGACWDGIGIAFEFRGKQGKIGLHFRLEGSEYLFNSEELA